MKIGKIYRADNIPYDSVRQEICYRYSETKFTSKTAFKIYNNDTECYEYWRVISFPPQPEGNWEEVELYFRAVDCYDERFYQTFDDDITDGQPLKIVSLSKSSNYEA